MTITTRSMTKPRRSKRIRQVEDDNEAQVQRQQPPHKKIKIDRRRQRTQDDDPEVQEPPRQRQRTQRVQPRRRRPTPPPRPRPQVQLPVQQPAAPIPPVQQPVQQPVQPVQRPDPPRFLLAVPPVAVPPPANPPAFERAVHQRERRQRMYFAALGIVPPVAVPPPANPPAVGGAVHQVKRFVKNVWQFIRDERGCKQMCNTCTEEKPASQMVTLKCHHTHTHCRDCLKTLMAGRNAWSNKCPSGCGVAFCQQDRKEIRRQVEVPPAWVAGLVKKMLAVATFFGV